MRALGKCPMCGATRDSNANLNCETCGGPAHARLSVADFYAAAGLIALALISPSGTSLSMLLPNAVKLGQAMAKVSRGDQ